MENDISFFSIVDYYWRFLWNFEKFPKISKGGTLGIFLLLEIFLKFWKFSQNIQRGDPWDFFSGVPPPKKKINAFLDELRIQKKCGTGLTPPLWKFPYFFFEPFPYFFLKENRLFHAILANCMQSAITEYFNSQASYILFWDSSGGHINISTKRWWWQQKV